MAPPVRRPDPVRRLRGRLAGPALRHPAPHPAAVPQPHQAAPQADLRTGAAHRHLDHIGSSKKCRQAADQVGATDLHFHDLRHLAGTLADPTGASTRELMARAGNSTPRASLIYQHATEQRGRHIAAGIDAVLHAASDPDATAAWPTRPEVEGAEQAPKLCQFYGVIISIG